MLFSRVATGRFEPSLSLLALVASNAVDLGTKSRGGCDFCVCVGFCVSRIHNKKFGIWPVKAGSGELNDPELNNKTTLKFRNGSKI